MRNIILFTILLWAFQTGCQYKDHLMFGSPATPPQTQTQPTNHRKYEGSLTGSNYVSVELSGAKDIEVWLRRGKDWSQLDTTGSTAKQAPSYQIKDGQVIFSNSLPTDYYDIEVWL